MLFSPAGHSIRDPGKLASTSHCSYASSSILISYCMLLNAFIWKVIACPPLVRVTQAYVELWNCGTVAGLRGSSDTYAWLTCRWTWCAEGRQRQLLLVL